MQRGKNRCTLVCPLGLGLGGRRLVTRLSSRNQTWYQRVRGSPEWSRRGRNTGRGRQKVYISRVVRKGRLVTK